MERVSSKEGLAAHLGVALAAVAWGSVGVMVRWSGLAGHESQLVLLRSALATAFFCGAALISGKASMLRLGKRPLLLLGSGLLLTFHWVVFFKAIGSLALGQAVFITYLAPVLVALMAPFLLRERMEGVTLVALALSLTGLSLMTTTASGQGGLRVGGVVFALLAAVTYALLLLILKKLREEVTALTVALYQSLVNVVVLLPFTGFRAFPVMRASWPPIVVLGLFHSGAVGLLYINAVKGVKAQRVGVISYLEPLSAYLFGWLALGEGLGWGDLLGGMLILAGGLLVILHRPHRVVSPAPKT